MEDGLGRESRVSIYRLQEMRVEMEEKMQENKEKLLAAAKIMVLKEREAWQSDKQQHLDEIESLKKKLFATEKQNKKLKADLYRGVREIELRDNKINSLSHRLSALEKKRVEQVTSLQQSLDAQKEETKSVRATATTRLEDNKKQWMEKVNQLEDLLTKKDQELGRESKKRRARTAAHIDTLAQLNKVEAALKESKLNNKALEESFQKTEKKLVVTEENFKVQQLEEEKRATEEMLLTKEKSTLVNNIDQRWQDKVNQLEELIEKREKQINRANKKLQVQKQDHKDTLVQLKEVKAALKESKLNSKALEESLQKTEKKLVVTEENFKEELQKSDERFKKQLSDNLLKASKEFSKLCETWQNKVQQLEEEKRATKEMLLTKEKSTLINNIDQRWQDKVNQLEELLEKREKQINRANKKLQVQKQDHKDTLVHLNKVEAALKKNNQEDKASKKKIKTTKKKLVKVVSQRPWPPFTCFLHLS
ncbi:trichohyalin-like [Mugil cephalus]|uniref:trichohyalin-like n=1 Tax=Mugil cephalus TaxID=48193 RepID=UPI001FB719B0|nr:trichohyalin-like [Mugil cephalus]XP_047463204.1 trichohyalin-like [Mugil cephalus]